MMMLPHRSRPPRLPRHVQRELNRLAAQRARVVAEGAFEREQRRLQSAALDLILAGRPLEAVLEELCAEAE